MRNLSQEVYAKIYFDMINMLKEDPILKKSINKNEIQFIEQTWCKKLQDHNILVNEDLRASNFLATLKMTSNNYFSEINKPFTNINQLMDAQYLKNRKERKIFLVQDRKTGKIHLKSNMKKEEDYEKSKYFLKTETNYVKKEEFVVKKKEKKMKIEKNNLVKKKEEIKTEKTVIKLEEEKLIKVEEEIKTPKIKNKNKFEISLSHLIEKKPVFNNKTNIYKEDYKNNTVYNKNQNKNFNNKEDYNINIIKKEEKLIKEKNLESDEDLFNSSPQKKKQSIFDYKKLLKKENLNKLMEKKIEEVLKIENIKKEEEININEIIDEEELNSNDDITDYDEEINTGNNLLLAYYEKFSRKKDKRKILMKNCVLRVEEMDFIFPVVKGDFLWIAAKNEFY